MTSREWAIRGPPANRAPLGNSTSRNGLLGRPPSSHKRRLIFQAAAAPRLGPTSRSADAGDSTPRCQDVSGVLHEGTLGFLRMAGPCPAVTKEAMAGLTARPTVWSVQKGPYPARPCGRGASSPADLHPLRPVLGPLPSHTHTHKPRPPSPPRPRPPAPGRGATARPAPARPAAPGPGEAGPPDPFPAPRRCGAPRPQPSLSFSPSFSLPPPAAAASPGRRDRPPPVPPPPLTPTPGPPRPLRGP